MTKAKRRKIGKFIYWTPRILSTLFMLFLALFSLDVFDGNYGFWETILALFMHNIPVFILAIILWISWKREIVGGIGFIVAGLAYVISAIIRMSTGLPWYLAISWSLIIAGPAFLIGILFLINWFKKKK